MAEKPTTAKDYSSDQSKLVRATCLYVATILGDYMESGTTIKEEKATRDIWVCGLGSYVVLKALAFRNRGENKDAYDLYYHVRNYGEGIQDVANALKKILQENETKRALRILKEDFTEHDGVGAVRVAEFITGDKDADIQADVTGSVLKLIDLCN